MDSVKLSIKLDIKHDDLMKIISKYIINKNKAEELIKTSYYKKSGMRSRSYDLTPQQVVLITLHSKSDLFISDIFHELSKNSIDKIYESIITLSHSHTTMNSTGGYIYCISTGDNNTKIGRTVRPTKRIKSIINDLGYNNDDVKIYISTISDNYVSTAVNLFRQFRGKSLNAGWFTLSYEDAKFEIQRAVCDSNHYHDIKCGVGCFICGESDIAFNICADTPEKDWLSGMINNGLSEVQAKRWYDIYFMIV